MTLGALAARCAYIAVSALVGRSWYPIFFLRSDQFADTVKSGLAVQPVTSTLLKSANVQSWPTLFRGYLYNNEYVQSGLGVHHAPPFMMLMLVAFAGTMVVSSPVTLIISLVFAYITAIAFVVRKFALSIISRDAICLGVVLLLSYPAMFMLDRGNFHSGFTSLGIMIYLSTVLSGRGRFVGLLAVAMAINIRPNAITILLIELRHEWRDCLVHLILSTFMIIVVSMLSIAISHIFDNGYTMGAFLRGYAAYNKAMVVENGGLQWNVSMYGAIKDFSFLVSWKNPALALTQGLVLALGTCCGLLAVFLIMTRKASLAESVFQACALSILFTPIYGEYHLLLAVAPLVVVMARGDRLAPSFDRLFWVGFLVLAVASLQANAYPSKSSVFLLLFLAAAAPLLFGRRCKEGSATGVIVGSSLLSLAPIGEAVTQGLAVSPLLFTALAFTLYIGVRRGPCTSFGRFVPETGDRRPAIFTGQNLLRSRLAG